MYIHLYSLQDLRRRRGLCNSRDRLLHPFPPRIAKFSPQSLFRRPNKVELLPLSLAGLREAEQALPPVLSPPQRTQPCLRISPSVRVSVVLSMAKPALSRFDWPLQSWPTR